MTDDLSPEQIEMMQAEFDLASGDLVAVANGMLTKVHKREKCAGRDLACWVHSPSDWPLANATVVWDDRTKRAYRICEHGTLHRDLDDWRWQARGSTKYVGMPPWCCPKETECACCRGGRDD